MTFVYLIVYGLTTIDIHSWPQYNRHSFMAAIQSTFILGPNIQSTFIHVAPIQSTSIYSPIQSTFIRNPNTIDIHLWPDTIEIHSWPQYNRHSFMALIQTTFIHGLNTIDIHSWLASTRKNCMGAFLFFMQMHLVCNRCQRE